MGADAMLGSSMAEEYGTPSDGPDMARFGGPISDGRLLLFRAPVGDNNGPDLAERSAIAGWVCAGKTR